MMKMPNSAKAVDWGCKVYKGKLYENGMVVRIVYI